MGFSGALEFGERLGSDGAARGVAGSLTGAAAQYELTVPKESMPSTNNDDLVVSINLADNTLWSIIER